MRTLKRGHSVLSMVVFMQKSTPNSQYHQRETSKLLANRSSLDARFLAAHSERSK
jgi:hypothetical protein